MPSIIPALSSYTLPTRYRWTPTVKSGQFYIGDRKYHLYAQKKCLRLEQCRIATWTLAGTPYAVTDVELDGVNYTNYKIVGQDIVVDLEDIDSNIAYWAQFEWDAVRWGYFQAGFVLTDDTQLKVVYSTLVWNTTTHGFDSTAVTQYLRLGDADIVYKIPDTLIPDTPIVITDDSKLKTDGRSYAIEYDVDGDGYINFNAPTNYAPNPNFEAAPAGYPAYPNDWEIVDTTGHIFRTPGTGYVGLYTLRMSDPTGKARAIVTMGSGEPISLSTWARMSGTGYSGVGYVEMVFRDVSGNILNASGTVIGADPDIIPYSAQAQASLSGKTWTRISITAGESTAFETTDLVIPTGTVEVEIRLHGTGTGPVDFSAVQLENNRSVSQYGYISPSSTVEYETDPTGLWRPDPTGIVWPYPELCHIECNAASDENHIGFFVMEEFSTWSDEDLTCGGIDDTDPTGLPRGIIPRTGMFWKFGRKNLPYARLDGYNKLVPMYPLRLQNQESEHFVNAYQTPRNPVRAIPVSPDNTRRVSDVLHTVMGTGITTPLSCIFSDVEGNSVPHELVTVTLTGDGSVDKASDYTNDAGRILVQYTAGSMTGISRATVAFRHVLSGLSETIHIDVV